MKNKKAFTLVEAIVVAVIVAILAGAGIPFFMGYLNDARIDSARTTIELVGAAVMHTHNRGKGIDTQDDWDAVGITDPGDKDWTFTFGTLASNAGDATVKDYAINATYKNGSSGTYKPNQDKGSRWTGVFECFD